MKKYIFVAINKEGKEEKFEKEMQPHEVQTYINWLYDIVQIQKLKSQQG